VAPAQGPRWLNPTTLGGTVLVFAIGYAIVQPLGLLFFSWMNGEPVPFTTPERWAVFVASVAGVGAVAGAAWYQVQRMRAGWWREWADATVRALGFMMLISSGRFSLPNIIVSSVFLGAFWAGVFRLVRRVAAPADRPTPPSDLPA